MKCHIITVPRGRVNKGSKEILTYCRTMADHKQALRIFNLHGYERVEFGDHIRFFSPAATRLYNEVINKNLYTKWETIKINELEDK